MAGGVLLDRDSVLGVLTAHGPRLRSMGVRRIGIFGSVLRGEAGPASDLDVLVEFERTSFDTYMNVKEYLESLFGCAVDLVVADALKPRLRPVVMAEAVYAPGL